MIRKYPWHLVYLLFVVLCLTNIFQKLKWTTPSDNITWEQTRDGLVCVEAPPNVPIKKGDLLLAVNKYVITNRIELVRAWEQRKFATYEIEHEGIARIVGIEVGTEYTPLSYYILVFSGILLILLTLRILNSDLRKREGIAPPTSFYLMALAFSGFLIFSPTGAYNTTDFIFLILDRCAFIFFPALMLDYALFYPFKLRIVRMINKKILRSIIYIPAVTLVILDLFFLVSNIIRPELEQLLLSINHFRKLSYSYFAIFSGIAFLVFLTSNLWLIVKKKQTKYWFPLTGICISIPAMIFLDLLITSANKSPSLIVKLIPFLLVFLPVSLTYYLGHRKFSDIENIIKKTVATASIFLFIFGIFFLLGSTLEQNRILGIFWSIAAILTAGLLFRPIEDTIHKYFEKLFFRGAADFKRKLTELIQSFRNERNISIIASNFLNTINNGFQLQKSAFIIHHRKNMFYSLPGNRKLILSGNFQADLSRNDNMIFFSGSEFERKYPKDYLMMKEMNYFQFLPLRTQNKLIGFIAFGPKMDNTYLSSEDWEIMFNIASPLTLSVENASLYSELESQLNEISLLKEFNENVIENINVGIVVLTKLNIIKTWNQFMEKKFQVSQENAIGTKAHTIFGHNLWKQIFRNKHGVSSIHNVKAEFLEEELIFDIHISPMKERQGKVVGTILVFEDVTEKVFMQSQLVTSEKMASLGLLSASIAHEVNTPLTGISSYCQLILDNPGDPENVDLTQKIQEQVQRANRIIRTLLNFSRQKGDVPMELDLNRLIVDTIPLVEHKLKKKNITLKMEFDFRRRVFGFATRLQQMLINLLINASDSMPEPNGTIYIYGSEDDENIILRIKDTGKGIDPKYLKKIFDPFFTTKGIGEGTGLGLSITYAIVQEHYGEISVNSKLNKGTTFIIKLPFNSPLRSINV